MQTVLLSWVFGASVLLAPFALPALAPAQQVVQRGAFGRPSQVLDETQQWSSPLLVASDRDVMIYMPDVSSPDWLQKNYREFLNRGTYTLTFFTFYRTTAACRTNQTAWGLGDAAHLNACTDIGYRLRQAKVDPQQKSVTLVTAAMTDKNGAVIPSTVMDGGTFRTWDQLDTNTQTALQKANELVSLQMKRYDALQQSAR